MEISLDGLFLKVRSDFAFLINCFKEVLEGLGELEALSVLDLIATEDSNVCLLEEQAITATGTRVLAIAFQLLNMAEENAANQYRRQLESTQETDDNSLYEHRIRQILALGVSKEELLLTLKDIKVEPVLTAHPTEARRNTILAHFRELYLLLVKCENSMYTPKEKQDIRESILVILERLWRSSLVDYSKPKVETELSQIIYYINEVFPVCLPDLDRRLLQSLNEANIDLPEPENMPKLTFGSWVGGDRDGHNLVTAEVTDNTLKEMRKTTILRLKEAIIKTKSRLSFEAGVSLSNFKEYLEKLCLETKTEFKEENFLEPFAFYLDLCLKKLPISNSGELIKKGDYHYVSHLELARDLKFLREALIEAGAKRIALNDLFELERRVLVFGFFGARLDIRQNSDMHEKAFLQLLDLAGLKKEEFIGFNEAEKIDFLLKELKTNRAFANQFLPLPNEADTVLSTLRVVSEHINNYGNDGLASIIVSMSRCLSDLLIVVILCKEAGLFSSYEGGGLIPALPIVPLFETVKDLQNASDIMHNWFSLDLVKSMLKEYKSQPIMIGYSDSCKGGGILASQWELHQAQISLSEIAKKHNVSLTFFHGRGGTISRGAGPTERFLEALPHKSLGGLIRMTEQGETIAQKYANRLNATFHLELLQAGVLATTIFHKQEQQYSYKCQEIMQKLAESSYLAYKGLVEKAGFIDFFEQATPIDLIELNKIGSRPAHRKKERSLENLRAIPWVFSWNQARFYLPGWYGVGSALSSLLENEPENFDYLKEELNNWPFLRYVFLNIDTGLNSASAYFMQKYASLVTNEAIKAQFLALILKEYGLSKSSLSQLLGGDFKERRPRLYETLKYRDKALAALHNRQISLLSEFRQNQDEKLVTPLLMLVNAIATGERTTG